MVVDDNHDAAEATKVLLELSGHEVKTVGNGADALASAPVFAPDVVMLDIGLPAMDGYLVARQLRELSATRSSCLIALTGYGQPADRERAREAGFDHHLTKPADPDALLALVDSAKKSARSRSRPIRRRRNSTGEVGDELADGATARAHDGRSVEIRDSAGEREAISSSHQCRTKSSNSGSPSPPSKPSATWLATRWSTWRSRRCSARLVALTSPAASAREPQQTLKQVSIVFLDVVGLDDAEPAARPGRDQRRDGRARSGAAPPSSGRTTARCCSTRATTSSLRSAPTKPGRTMPNARCVAGWRCSTLGRALGCGGPGRARLMPGFDVRVGIHTGGVLLGGGVDADGTIRGVAVNIAARMEQTAPAGALAHQPGHLRARCAGCSRSKRRSRLLVKGVDDPIQSYLVLRAKPRSFRIGTRGIEGVATRMIGREAELASAAGRLQAPVRARGASPR